MKEAIYESSNFDFVANDARLMTLLDVKDYTDWCGELIDKKEFQYWLNARIRRLKGMAIQGLDYERKDI